MTESTRDGTYLKLPVKRYAPKTIRETAEGRYWRAYKSTGLVNQVSQVTSVHFADAYPHQLAVTSSARVSIFSSQSRRSTRTFSRFKDVAYSGVLRDDGKTLAVGGQQGWVQLFDMSSRSVLRKFTTHTRAVRAVRFSPHDHATLCSGSDDTTVRVWDIGAGACARRHDGHTDYVRSVAGHASSADVWASGSYDHTVKLWDARDASRAAGMTLDHGAPVEDIAWLPTGSLLVSVGGQDVCVWDVLGGGRLLQRLRCHQKTVMCCHVAPDGGPPPVFDDDVHVDAFAHRGAMRRVAPRLLTGSLDGHVKVHELDGFTVTHSAKYPGPVLSVALSPDANLLAVGTANKLLSLRKRNKPRESRADAVPLGEGRSTSASGGLSRLAAAVVEGARVAWTLGVTTISFAGRMRRRRRATLGFSADVARDSPRTITRFVVFDTARRSTPPWRAGARRLWRRCWRRSARAADCGRRSRAETRRRSRPS